MTKIKIKSDDDRPEANGLAITVGAILIICACTVIISATAALVKWILGL